MTRRPVKSFNEKLQFRFYVLRVFGSHLKQKASRTRLSRHRSGVELARYPVIRKALSVLRARAGCGDRLFTKKFAVVVHYLLHQPLDHLLADDAILLARQFCDRLRDRVDHFVGLTGIDFAKACCRRIFGKEIVDQLDHHAMEAGALLVFSLSGITFNPCYSDALEHPNVV
jgi:hypothetical protein